MEERLMRKTALLVGVLVIAAILAISASVDIRPAQAEESYSVEHVFHTVKVLYNGYVFINDTLELNVNGSLNYFLIGLPAGYGQSLVKCLAFNDNETFPVTLNVPLSGRVGFYGVKVTFGSQTPKIFTVGFVLSNSLLTQNAQNTSLYSLDFPAYPSLTTVADFCNVSIVIPEGANITGGNITSLSYGQADLPEFTYFPASLDFEWSNGTIPIADITLQRAITVSELGQTGGVDTYDILNKASTPLGLFQVFLPPNATNPTATDEAGISLQLNQVNASTNSYNVTLYTDIMNNTVGSFAITYSLPNKRVVESPTIFMLNLPMFQYENYYINETLVTITFPTGAKVTTVNSNSAGSVSSVYKGFYQETVTLDQKNVIVLNEASVEIDYEYNSIWASFIPTLWVLATALIGCMGFAVVQRLQQKPRIPSPTPTMGMRASPELFKSFVETYEEKRTIETELESLETRVEKGRIPRRRYKVMKRTLEARRETALRSLATSKERMRTIGGKYSEMMLQLEVAEAEIGEAKTSVKNAESLHNRGELSLEAYRNRLAEYQRRREKAETTITGILLRLREEVR
jgi:hypothetical protein